MWYRCCTCNATVIRRVAELLKKRSQRVARNLQVCVLAQQVHMKAIREKQWDERHAPFGLSHALVEHSLEQDRKSSVALAATWENAFSVLMVAPARREMVKWNTLEGFADEHWQLQFTNKGVVECVCCAWAAICNIPGVATPKQHATALVQGTYGVGMRMVTPGAKTWRKEVLEVHRGVSRGSACAKKKGVIVDVTTKLLRALSLNIAQSDT